MAGVKIHGIERPLKEVFSDQYLYLIPPYQRAYAWTTDEVTELLDDLFTAIDESDPTDPDPYFLGSVVLAKAEGLPESGVIDGQQRLTTLTLLLSALAQRIDSGEKLWKYVLQESDEFAGADEVARLTMRPRDASFFHEYVQVPGGLDRLDGVDAAHLNDACTNIRANALLIRKRLAAEGSDRAHRLATYLLQHCYIIVVSTPDSDAAFRIFAVLNDRGLDLTPADLIKNELLGNIIGSAPQDAYVKKWEDAEDALGKELFGDLFSHIRMIYAKNKLRTSLLRAFRTSVLDQVQDPRSFIDDVVSPYADILASVSDRNWRATEHAGEINTLIGWLQRIDNFDWIPPALRYLRDRQGEPPSVLAFLRGLERLAASMFMRRIGINARIDRYGRLLEQIDDGQDVLERGSELDLTAQERQETIDRLDGAVYASGRPRSYVLLRLDAHLSAGGAVYEHDIITVEHVLPQHPPANSQWAEWFTEEERDSWVDRLANLVLLDGRRNSAASNHDFESKKLTYFTRSNQTSPFVLTTQVLAAPDWTPQRLQDRQQTLLHQLIDVWKLHPNNAA